MTPHIDWTINFSDILVMLGFLTAAAAVLFKMHIRVVLLEDWMERHQGEADKYIGVIDSVGKALEKVTTLYENQDDRLDSHSDRLTYLERKG